MEYAQITYPPLSFPASKEEAFALAERLTGDAWNAFSSPRHASGYNWDLTGGQTFLALRIKGRESAIVQPLCVLCGQGVLTPEELIIALGRDPKKTADGKWEEKQGGACQSKPSREFISKIHQYGAELFPSGKYRRETKPYDSRLPGSASMPYIYVIRDALEDIKIGITMHPKTRFRAIESHEQTTINDFVCQGPSPYAYAIEQQLLGLYGSGRHPTKKSREWLIGVSLQEAADAVRSALRIMGRPAA